MDQLGPRGFRTNMVVQRPVLETNSVRDPTATFSGSPDGPTQLTTCTPSPRPSGSLLDGEKIGTTLMFSGAFLAIVGVTFTVTGWQQYLVNSTFEWSQLLGPILISVGGTFMLTSVCKFGINSCLPCRQWDEEVFVMAVTEQTSTRHSFTLSGVNQPVMLRGATTMLCFPPPYNSVNHEVCQATEFQPGGTVNGVHAAISPHDAVYYVDNVAFTAEEGSSAHSTETDCRRSRTEKAQDERGRDDDSGSTCSRPPAYEDIYPSFSKHNLT